MFVLCSCRLASFLPHVWTALMHFFGVVVIENRTTWLSFDFAAQTG